MRICCSVLILLALICGISRTSVYKIEIALSISTRFQQQFRCWKLVPWLFPQTSSYLLAILREFTCD